MRGLPIFLAALALLGMAAGGCGGGQEGARRPPTPTARQLALLPDLPELRRQLLFADLGRLRAAYPDPAGFRRALEGVWLPDALVAADRRLWRRSFGIDLESVERFSAGGFHPAELLVASGRFDPEAVRTTLRGRGYVLRRGVMQRGADGALDPRTPAGRLALSSLNRVAVSPTRLIAGSTTALVKAAASPPATLAEDEDLSAAATALGETTSAALFPAEIVRPLEGAFVVPIARHPAVVLGIGLDDRGSDGRTVKVALADANRSDAREDADSLAEQLPNTSLPSRPGTRFGDILENLEVRIEAERTVLVTADLPPGQSGGLWRLLFEEGDLSVLVRP